MKVLIVGKTRMGKSSCIGAIAENGKSLRLYPSRDYQIGQVWDIDYTPRTDRKPPHTEDVIVNRKRCVEELSLQNQVKTIEGRMPPIIGPPRNLYKGLLQIGERGRHPLYIAEQSGVPGYSTTFWRPDKPLTRLTQEEAYDKRYDMNRVRIFYRYPTKSGGCTLAFVGFQESLETIPAETLLRVSLAGWWRKREDVEERCYAQLSGWYL